MPVQAAIVAGGRGSRMLSVNDRVPKSMLPVGGKPLLERQLDWLKAAGFGHAFLCLGHKAGAVMDYFGDGGRFGLRLEYQVEAVERGTAGAVRDLRPRLRGDALVVYGDLFIDMDLRRLLEFHAGHAAAATLVVRETDHPLDSDLVRAEGDRVTGFYRARAGEPHGNLACAAVWVVRPRLLDLVPADAPCDFGRDLFPRALERGEELRAYRTSETVADLGTPQRLDAFLRRWEAGA